MEGILYRHLVVLFKSKFELKFLIIKRKTIKFFLDKKKNIKKQICYLFLNCF